MKEILLDSACYPSHPRESVRYAEPAKESIQSQKDADNRERYAAYDEAMQTYLQDYKNTLGVKTDLPQAEVDTEAQKMTLKLR